MIKKCIENYSEDELKGIMPDISYEIVHIAYGYYHKGRMPVSNYAKQCCISVSTLYRYIKIIENTFNERVSQ